MTLNQINTNTTMKNTEYNGWTNYATWRVNLEVFDGWDRENGEIDAECAKEFAEELVLPDVEENTLAYGYTSAFLSEVNWHEISEAVNTSLLP